MKQKYILVGTALIILIIALSEIHSRNTKQQLDNDFYKAEESLKNSKKKSNVLFSISNDEVQRTPTDLLLDGLHQDAHEGNFQDYFARYAKNAVFLGTDKTERWTIEEFKAYAKPADWKSIINICRYVINAAKVEFEPIFIAISDAEMQ